MQSAAAQPWQLLLLVPKNGEQRLLCAAQSQIVKLCAAQSQIVKHRGIGYCSASHSAMFRHPMAMTVHGKPGQWATLPLQGSRWNPPG
jgi:hypothetical protein